MLNHLATNQTLLPHIDIIVTLKYSNYLEALKKKHIFLKFYIYKFFSHWVICSWSILFFIQHSLYWFYKLEDIYLKQAKTTDFKRNLVFHGNSVEYFVVTIVQTACGMQGSSYINLLDGMSTAVCSAYDFYLRIDCRCHFQQDGLWQRVLVKSEA